MEMIQINLLPKEFRKKTGGAGIGKTGYYAIGASFGVIIMIAVVTMYQMFQLKELDEKMQIARFRTQQMQKDISVVDALIDVKGKIMQRMEAVDKLDRHRTVWVRVLENVTRQIPEFTWLSVLKEDVPQTSKTKGDTATAAPETMALNRPVSIEGYSFTLNSLANFMIKLMRSHFFSEVEMAAIEEVEILEQKAYNYKLTATLHYLSDEELKKVLENESGPDLLASF
ncbi:MAG: PilN domain-containing protein [FCB group bacterium]|nr:PilN domain-containing protein [FCB group bacterium]